MDKNNSKKFFHETEAYDIQEIYSCETPYLPILRATYILTMKDSNRINNIDPLLLNMSQKTYVQYNDGFIKKRKPNVNNTSRDIIHAVKNVCSHANKDDYILILEDDAIPFIKSTNSFAYHCRLINKFIEEYNPNIYTLGSLSLFWPYKYPHQKILGNFMGFTQAVIYSSSTRMALLDTNIKYIKHIDAHFLSKQTHKFAYAFPLVVQLFPFTSNMKEWSISISPSKIEEYSVQIFIFILQKILGLQYSKSGWLVLYLFNYIIIISIISIIYYIISSYK